jgi:hypothetical protein
MTITTGTALDIARTALVERLPQLLDEVRDGLRESWPDYAEFLDHDREGVIEAAKQFAPQLLEAVSLEGDGQRDGLGDHTLQMVFEQIGRRQLRLGSDLARLLTAFQFGSRLAWRHVSAAALESRLAPADLAALADAVFGFVNKLSFAAARGYLLEQVEDARTRERNREELAALLLSGRASQPAIRSAARRAGWRVPATAAVALIDPDDAIARRVIDGLGPDALRFSGNDRYGAIIPVPADGAGRIHLGRLLQGASAVVGSVVSLDLLPRSTEVAEIAARLQQAGLLADDPVFADEHLDTIIVCRDARLLESLRRQVLAPLADLPESTRTRLLETMTSWLRTQGDRMAMARELRVHPQTVRYRMAQLRKHFGARLDDADSRARLLLALHWRQ